MHNNFEYDVAISYAGPDKHCASEIARLLQEDGLFVFFDRFDEARMLGKRLAIALQDIYENKARFCVILISKHYSERVWPKHELRAAFSRAVREVGEYILPIRLDDTQIEGLPSDLSYLSMENREISEISRIIRDKVRLSEGLLVPISHLDHSAFAQWPDADLLVLANAFQLSASARATDRHNRLTAMDQELLESLPSTLRNLEVPPSSLTILAACRRLATISPNLLPCEIENRILDVAYTAVNSSSENLAFALLSSLVTVEDRKCLLDEPVWRFIDV